MKSNTGSFRDPNGKIFEKDGNIIRVIYPPGQKDYLSTKAAGIHKKLIDSGLLLPHSEINPPDKYDHQAIYLQHPRLKMVSYPWEWSFSMLKDAALLHLKVMRNLIPDGFWLRDASAFNAQYDGRRLLLIDTLSIGPRPVDSPWVAYGQFCSHFLAPLALAAYGDIRTLSMWKCFIDGFPLDMAANLLPLRKSMRPGLFMHLKLHAKYQLGVDRKDNFEQVQKKHPKVSDLQLTGLLNSLEKTVARLKWRRVSPIWEAYGDLRTYTDSDVTYKTGFVKRIVRQLQPGLVWDLGANTGEFSLIAAKHGAFVVSIDSDAACVEQLYQKVREERIENVLPLTMDLANPSPALGWNCTERMSLAERGQADLAFALAFIHHLVFKNCIPLTLIAQWFRQIARHIIIEFVPENDPMVVKLLMHRGEDHHPYSQKHFESAFVPHFKFHQTATLENGRLLYHLEAC